MRAPRFVVYFACCAIGCSRSSTELPAKAMPAQQASVPQAPPITPKKVATREVINTAQVDESADSFDLEKLNPVKMNRNVTTGGSFNPFAK